MEITTSDGVKLYFEVKGQGTPCLYLHGGPGSGSWWMQKFSDGMFEKYFQMIYLDQRGVARSASPQNGDYSLDRLVRDFEEVRTALGIDSWLTMGHSFGGLLQMGYVLRHPKAIKGMLMINCTLDIIDSTNRSWCPKGCEILGIDDPWYTNPAVFAGKRVNKLGGLLREKGLFWKMAYTDPKSEEIMNASFADIPDWNNDMSDRVMEYSEYFQSFCQYSSQVNVPVLFFYGMQDWMVGPEHYRQAHFPELMVWPSQVGHVAILENKSDLETAIASFAGKYQF